MLDEISFIRPNIQEALWASIAPSLSTGGKLILTTTPNGDTDLFARLWRESIAGLNRFAHLMKLYHEHPERGEGSGYREDMLEKLGELRVRVELDCEFLSSDALLVNSQRLIELRHKPPLFEDNGFKFWDIHSVNSMYLVGADIATGSGRDFSVIQVYEFPSLQQIAEYRSNILNIPELYQKLKWILELLSTPNQNKRAEIFWTYERNGIGEAITALYNTDDNPPEFAELVSDVPGKFGMQTTNRAKVLACLQLKTLIEKINNGISINSEMAIYELKNFIISGGSYAAKQGSTDDVVCALLLIVRLLKHVGDFDDKARRLLYEYHENDYNPSGDFNNSANDDDEPIPFLVG
jgi:hypothetical protein